MIKTPFLFRFIVMMMFMASMVFSQQSSIELSISSSSTVLSSSSINNLSNATINSSSSNVSSSSLSSSSSISLSSENANPYSKILATKPVFPPIKMSSENDTTKVDSTNLTKDSISSTFSTIKPVVASAENPMGRVYIKSNPSKADVYLNGLKISTTPYKSKDIKIGSYDYEIRLKNHITDTITINVIADSTVISENHLFLEFSFPSAQSIKLTEYIKPNLNTIEEYNLRLKEIDRNIAAVTLEYEDKKDSNLSTIKPLNPKDEFETTPAFEKRKAEHELQTANINNKNDQEYKSYIAQISEVKEIVKSNKANINFTVITKDVPLANINLGKYNADLKSYPISAKLDEPAYKVDYNGNMYVDIETAKLMKEKKDSLTGLITHLAFKYPEKNGIYVEYEEFMLNFRDNKYVAEGVFTLPLNISQDSSYMLLKKEIAKGPKKTRKKKTKLSKEVKKKIIGFVTMGIGAAVLGYSGYTYKKAMDKSDEYNPVSINQANIERDEIRKLEKNSRIAAGIGGVIFASSIVILTF